jgi:hypothetical protein
MVIDVSDKCIAFDVSEKCIAFIFSVEQSYRVYCSRNVDPKNGTTALLNVGNYLPVDME